MTAKSMAEVLLAHWGHNCSPDKCTCSCGELIKHWGDGVDSNKALADHQAAALSAAGFGLVADAKAEAWDEGAIAVWILAQSDTSPSNHYRALREHVKPTPEGR